MKDYENVFYFEDIITFERWIEKYQINPDQSAYFSDGVHPSQLTYQVWAKDIAAGIAKVLKHDE